MSATAQTPANIARNVEMAAAMTAKANESCSFGSAAYYEALDNAAEALAQVKEDRAALAALQAEAAVTVGAITAKAAGFFFANRASAQSTQVFLTEAQAQELRTMCIAAGLRRNKPSEFQLAVKLYDNEGTYGYAFPCPKAKHCFLLTESSRTEKGGILYGTDYGYYSNIAPLND